MYFIFQVIFLSDLNKLVNLTLVEDLFVCLSTITCNYHININK